MSGWIGKLFGIGYKATKKLPQQAVKSQAMQKVATKVESKIEPTVAQQVTRPHTKTLGDQLHYGKWYYGIDTNAKPIVNKTLGGIEKRYPCKDGGEVVVNYVKRADGSSRLDIAKTGNPRDDFKGDWYRSFYSDTSVKHLKGRFGDDVTRTIKKKGARKQILSTQNGHPTEDVHVPLKRTEITSRGLDGKKRIDNDMLSSNPNDFDRFI